MEKADLPKWLLTSGLAFVFAYAAISSFVTPNDWIGYLPAFLRHSSNAKDWLHLFSAYEMLLALWLLSGRYLRYSSALTALTLLGIIFANPHQLPITFRDVGLLAAALALVFWPPSTAKV